jgi:hypothetical protein
LASPQVRSRPRRTEPQRGGWTAGTHPFENTISRSPPRTATLRRYPGRFRGHQKGCGDEATGRTGGRSDQKGTRQGSFLGSRTDPRTMPRPERQERENGRGGRGMKAGQKRFCQATSQVGNSAIWSGILYALRISGIRGSYRIMSIVLLAKDLGLSISTVSRALRLRRRFRRDTARVVLRAKAIGYRPNPSARRLGAGKTSPSESSFPRPVARGRPLTRCIRAFSEEW